MFGQLQGYDGCQLSGIALGGGRHLGNIGISHKTLLMDQAEISRFYLDRFPRHTGNDIPDIEI